MIYMKTKKD